MRRRLVVLVVSVALLAGGLAGGAAPASGQVANPVLLVAGLLSPDWVLDSLQDRLEADGFTVYKVALPGLGTGDIAQSAPAVDAFVDQIRAETGAARVDVVGHSEGGLASRYYIKYLGGVNEVGRYVSLGSPQYGTSLANLGAFFLGCLGMVACRQMAIGSSFLATLNAGDDTPGTVAYTAVYTNWDELVRPVTNASLQDGATNVRVQAHCPFRVVGHVGLVYNGTVYGLVRSALRGGPISTNCWAV